MSPIIVGSLNTKLGAPKEKPIKILLDTGTSATIILGKHVKKLRNKEASATQWKTKAGTFTTTHKVKLQLRLPEFDTKKIIEWNCHVDNTTCESKYDMIIGTDFMQALKIDLKFSDNSIVWDDATVPMQNWDLFDDDEFLNTKFEEYYKSSAVQQATSRMTTILDAKYEKADLDNVVKSAIHLSESKKSSLRALLGKYEELFDGTLGKWRGHPLDLELKPGVTPYHARPFPVPKSQEKVFKKEVERLCELGVLRKINRSKWAAPTFIQPKKNGTVQFLSDFRELNKRIKRKPYPLPNIQDLLMKLEGFQYASSLDLNMGYYHIELSTEASKLCTIVLPWGKYKYCRLPMGVCNSPDVFQEQMNELFAGFEFVRAYIDDLLILTKEDWRDHLHKLEQVLSKLREAGLKVNANKSFFGRSETKYLGFWITRQGIRPISSKVEAIRQIAPPKTRKELRHFIGLINYYRDMWIKRSEILAPLARLTSTKNKWQWTPVEQKAFDNMKKVLSKDVLLRYPNFNAKFDIYTDASKSQLGAVITQNKKPIAFYSRKLNPAQTRYTTTERELLSIVETLKEFRNILLGQEIEVFTDHKNLTYKEFNTERVMRWRLLIEEYGPTLTYLKGERNVVADIMSRLPTMELERPDEQDLNTFELAKNYGLDKNLLNVTMPVNYKTLNKYQKLDKELLKKAETSDSYHIKTFRGGEKERPLICYGDKIVVPTDLQQNVIEWYHTTLCHPGIHRTEETIRQHLWWSTMRNDIGKYLKKCKTCQKHKKTYKQYGKLPEKVVEDIPWQRLCVDLIGPWKLKRNDNKIITLRALTLIDPATGWFEMIPYENKQSITIANLTEIHWLSRYPWPELITYDRGSKFIGHEFKNMVKEDYGITVRPITKRNPQANAIIERIHQVLTNMIRTFELETYTDPNEPWAGIIAAASFAIRSTYHTTLKKTPGQLVFGRDMILNITHEANWQAISEQKQRLIKYNNERENRSRIEHTYHVGDDVLMINPDSQKIETPYLGPYKVTAVHDNGTLTIKKEHVYERLNIRQLKPYFT